MPKLDFSRKHTDGSRSDKTLLKIQSTELLDVMSAKIQPGTAMGKEAPFLEDHCRKKLHVSAALPTGSLSTSWALEMEAGAQAVW